MLISSATGSSALASHPLLTPYAVLSSLDTGDVIFTGNGPNGSPVLIGVELKSVDDLIASVSNGRLTAFDGQLNRMVSAFDVVWLLIYGVPYRANVEAANRNGERIPALQPAKLRPQKVHANHANRFTLEWHDGYTRKPITFSFIESVFASPKFPSSIRIHHVADFDSAAAFIRILYDSWGRPYESHRGLDHGFDESRIQGLLAASTSTLEPTDPDVELRARTFVQWPMLGYERAWAAARHFTSVEEAVTASADEWAGIVTRDTVSGRERRFGKVVAAAVVKSIKRRVKPA